MRKQAFRTRRGSLTALVQGTCKGGVRRTKNDVTDARGSARRTQRRRVHPQGEDLVPAGERVIPPPKRRLPQSHKARTLSLPLGINLPPLRDAKPLIERTRGRSTDETANAATAQGALNDERLLKTGAFLKITLASAYFPT